MTHSMYQRTAGHKLRVRGIDSGDLSVAASESPESPEGAIALTTDSDLKLQAITA